MKTFRMIGMALVAMMLCFTMSSCDNAENDEVVDPYKDYPQLIVGKWFNFTPEVSIFEEYKADGTYFVVGSGKGIGWLSNSGTYSLKNNQLTNTLNNADGSTTKSVSVVEIAENKLVYKSSENGTDLPLTSEKICYRVKEQFDIKGNYSYLNAVARVVAA